MFSAKDMSVDATGSFIRGGWHFHIKKKNIKMDVFLLYSLLALAGVTLNTVMHRGLSQGGDFQLMSLFTPIGSLGTSSWPCFSMGYIDLFYV